MRIVSPTEPAAAPTAATPTAAPEKRSLRLDANGPSTRPWVDTSFERRETLERELDRVQTSLLGERGSFGQQLTWLMLSQALLLNAFLGVLILGWSTPLPGKRLLLAGLAVFAAVVAVLIVLALRGTRDAVMSLHQQRKSLEATLQKDFGRAPIYAPRTVVTRGLAGVANGLLPGTFVAGWIALTIYALAAPLVGTTDPAGNLAGANGLQGATQAAARSAPRAPARPASGAPSVPDAQVADAAAADSVPASPAVRRPGGFKW